MKVLGAEMPRQRYHVLHAMNFESPYVDMPQRLTVRQNLNVFGRSTAVADLNGRIAALAESSTSWSSSTGRPASSRPGRRRGSLWRRR